MKKKNYILGTSLVLGIMIGSIVAGEVQETEKVKPIGSGSMIAMYIQDEDGNYQLSDAQEFPKDGYVLNTEKSSCKNGGKITQNASTKALNLKVKTSDECTVYFEKERFITLANGLKTNSPTVVNYEDGEKTEMYVFDHDKLTTTTEYNGTTTYTHSATQVMDWTSEERRDYRYIGANPNNYVTFNDEIWRIIGVFTVETETGNKEQLIKIIRNESIGDIPWDDYTDGDRANEWSTSSLHSLLNGEYYNTEGSFSYTYKTSSSSTGKTITIPKGLNATARSQIAKVKWYLGGGTYGSLGGPDYYNFERGTTVYSGRTTSIIANIGLMYPSDYVYTYANGVNDTCYTDGISCATSYGGTPSAGWLYNDAYQWFLSPTAAGAYIAFRMDSTGFVDSYINVNATRGVRPTVYLNSKIAITSGDGSQGNPYVLS